MTPAHTLLARLVQLHDADQLSTLALHDITQQARELLTTRVTTATPRCKWCNSPVTEHDDVCDTCAANMARMSGGVNHT